MSIGNLIKESVDDLVREIPPRHGLADAALRQARRRRTARVAVGGAAALAVAGAALLAALGPMAGGSGPSPADGGGEGSVVIDLDNLPAGPPPNVPWFADGVIHLGDTEVPFDFPVVQLGALQPVARGAVVHTRPEFSGPDVESHEGYGIYLVDHEGNVEQLADGFFTSPAVSADGGLIAWADEEWDFDADPDHPARTTLQVADATSGEVLHIEREGDSGPHFGNVIGFLDNQRVLVEGTDIDHNRADELFLWDIAAGTVEQWGEYRFAGPLAQSGDVGVFTRPSEERVVLDTVTRDELWVMTGGLHFFGNAFSPDGQYAAGPEFLPDRTDIAIVEARTGHELVRFEVEPIDERPMVWEPDGSLVFEARNGTEAALVRCTVAGDCELATAPRETEAFPDQGIRSAYFVGSAY